MDNIDSSAQRPLSHLGAVEPLHELLHFGSQLKVCLEQLTICTFFLTLIDGVVVVVVVLLAGVERAKAVVQKLIQPGERSSDIA